MRSGRSRLGGLGAAEVARIALLVSSEGEATIVFLRIIIGAILSSFARETERL
jgi:hypothetical protein